MPTSAPAMSAMDEVQSLKAYLSTVVTRLCLDHLRSAKAQREVYVGPWLPEPVLTNDLTALPAEATEQADDISLAFMLLLERLTPEERATYVLREAFAYPFEEIGAVLGKSSAAVRQLSHRAKERIAAGGHPVYGLAGNPTPARRAFSRRQPDGRCLGADLASG